MSHIVSNAKRAIFINIDVKNGWSSLVPINKLRMDKLKLGWGQMANGGDSVNIDIIKYIIKALKKHFMEFLFIKVFYSSRRIYWSTSDSDLRNWWVTQVPIVLVAN